jgi:lipoprotein NlpI
VIREDREFAEAYFNRGLLYIYTGQKALANADLSKAGELGIVEAYNIIKRYCKDIE